MQELSRSALVTKQTLAKVAFIVMFFAIPERTKADLAPSSTRKEAPAFALKDFKGATIKLSDFKGRVVLLDFWATYCDVCRVEIPWYMEFHNKYKDSGLSVVGVSVDDDGLKSVKPFLTEEKVNYLVVIGNWELAARFGVKGGLPVTLLVDRSGKIAESHVGEVDKNAFEKEIQILLKEPVK
jgi:cytochrome c biogenesis protein CcmG/thiol:disulfide interchange protein DsbE